MNVKNTNTPNKYMMKYSPYISQRSNSCFCVKWHINERLHRTMLDQNAMLENEY